ncbi:MAG: hypothetical protein KDB27_32610 [Planctomycetales bacterium]|nr:hypothetical protein [Planctomycetales bacterium]
MFEHQAGLRDSTLAGWQQAQRKNNAEKQASSISKGPSRQKYPNRCIVPKLKNYKFFCEELIDF